MKRPDLKKAKPDQLIKYIEFLEEQMEGSSALMEAINALNKAYANEINERIKTGALLADDDLFDKYIKITAQSTKIKEFSPVTPSKTKKVASKEDNFEGDEEPSKDSIFEQKARIVKEKLKNGGQNT